VFIIPEYQSLEITILLRTWAIVTPPVAVSGRGDSNN
jgi:hypothetical protein